MANQNDSAIWIEINSRPKWNYLDCFLANHDRIQDDSNYWQMLAAIWIVSGNNYRLDEWIRLFRSPRRNRHKIMKGKDRRTFDALPPIVTAYRASNPEEDLERMIAWTIDRSVLVKFGHGRQIVERRFQKAQILAYFDRRQEREIIVLPERQVA